MPCHGERLLSLLGRLGLLCARFLFFRLSCLTLVVGGGLVGDAGGLTRAFGGLLLGLRGLGLGVSLLGGSLLAAVGFGFVLFGLLLLVGRGAVFLGLLVLFSLRLGFGLALLRLVLGTRFVLVSTAFLLVLLGYLLALLCTRWLALK